MTFVVQNKYSLDIIVNGIQLSRSNTILQQVIIAESVHQALPTVDMTLVIDNNLLEQYPLTDGSKIDLQLTINQTGQEETLRLETILWSYESYDIHEGKTVNLHCVMSAPDFFESRIESINGSSFDVFNLMANRSRLQLISDSSIDKQIWIRPGIRGNIWLNEVINHSWSSPKSAFVYAVTRQRELLKYNLDERASKSPKWTFRPDREFGTDLSDTDVLYKYPKFSSQSGFFNTFFGYGKNLYSFNIETGEKDLNKAQNFTKRVNFMNYNSEREVPQRYGSLGFNNALNVHENYFDAYAQNMRIKSLYSFRGEVLSSYFRDVRLLDRIALQLTDEPNNSRPSTNAGQYFVDKISTIITETDVTRKFSLVREGFNADSSASNNSK